LGSRSSQDFRTCTFRELERVAAAVESVSEFAGFDDPVQERGQEGCLVGHGVGVDALGSGVGVGADGAEAIQGGDPEGGGEVAVGGTGGADRLRRGKPDLVRGMPGEGVQAQGLLGFEGVAIDPALDGEGCTGQVVPAAGSASCSTVRIWWASSMPA
jgi:hypothetical protein